MSKKKADASKKVARKQISKPETGKSKEPKGKPEKIPFGSTNVQQAKSAPKASTMKQPSQIPLMAQKNPMDVFRQPT